MMPRSCRSINQAFLGLELRKQKFSKCRPLNRERTRTHVSPSTLASKLEASSSTRYEAVWIMTSPFLYFLGMSSVRYPSLEELFFPTRVGYSTQMTSILSDRILPAFLILPHVPISLTRIRSRNTSQLKLIY